MLVYRVEHKQTGTGPYVSGELPPSAQWIARRLNDAHGGSFSHPVISWGESIRFTRDMFCGFTCMEKLLQWFGEFTPQLDQYGFVIRVYETKTVWFGSSGRQIAIKKRGVKMVREISLNSPSAY